MRFIFNASKIVQCYKKPILTDIDVINVSKSLLSKKTELPGEILKPIFSSYGLYSIISEN